MFERFTSEARRVIVLAQEEARLLQHNYIGTEHLLLGLLHDGGEIAQRAAESFGLTLEAGRDDVLAIIGRGKQPQAGHIPFTPRAKKTLELALREALALRHDYIGPEHILLGLVREGHGVAAQILTKRAGSLDVVRAAVLTRVPAPSRPPHPVRIASRTWQRLMGGRAMAGRQQGPGVQEEHEEAETALTPAADASLAEATRLAGSAPVGSHHLLLAALADANSAASRVLASLGVDLDRARESLRQADVAGSSDELPEEAGRRQMVVRVSGDRVSVEATDDALVAVGRATTEALGVQDGVIRGDSPLAASLADVWQALHDSLSDIRARAAAAQAATGPEAGSEP